MAFYETVFIARQDLSKPDVQKLIDQFSETLTKTGGKIVKTEYWGLRNLAYRINKMRKGHYVLIATESPSDAVKEMERTMRINEEIIRVLTVNVKAISQEPSPLIARAEEEGEGREGREPREYNREGREPREYNNRESRGDSETNEVA